MEGQVCVASRRDTPDFLEQVVSELYVLPCIHGCVCANSRQETLCFPPPPKIVLCTCPVEPLNEGILVVRTRSPAGKDAGRMLHRPLSWQARASSRPAMHGQGYREQASIRPLRSVQNHDSPVAVGCDRRSDAILAVARVPEGDRRRAAAGPGSQGPPRTDDSHQPAHNCHNPYHCNVGLESFHGQLGPRHVPGPDDLPPFLRDGNKPDQHHLDLPVAGRDLFVPRLRIRSIGEQIGEQQYADDHHASRHHTAHVACTLRERTRSITSLVDLDGCDG